MSLLDTLTWLVDIPSVIGNEGRLCTVIAERLLPKYGPDAVERIGNSLVVGRRTGRPVVLIVGHIDTVPEQGQSAATVEGGRLSGLGSSDMKAGLAVMLHLLEDPNVFVGPYDVIGIFYDKEEGPADENGLVQVLAKADWLTDADFAIVLEPTDLELQLGCMGAINATVSFLGTPAHSARPWLGENAVTKAGRWLAELHERPPDPVVVGGLEFREVYSVTKATAGVANNIIPGRFDLNLNYRFAPDKQPYEAERALRLMTAAADEVKVEDLSSSAPVPSGHPMLEALMEISGADVAPKQAWTDVARLAEVGVAAVNYGPGETSQAHQVGESVAVENLDIAFANLVTLLTRE